MGNDAVYQEFVLHTMNEWMNASVNECICGLKKGGPLLVSCRRQSDWFISKFLWSEVTWCWPDFFFLPWRLHSWVIATHLWPFPLSDYISILCSFYHSFEIVLVINSEQFSIEIAFAFFTAPLMEVNLLILILNLIFMANWANGLCTQGLFTSFVAIFGKSEQIEMALFPLICSRYCSCFPDFSLNFETTASYKNWADWQNRLANSSVSPIMLWFWELGNSENLREPNSGIPKLVVLCHWFRGWA